MQFMQSLYKETAAIRHTAAYRWVTRPCTNQNFNGTLIRGDLFLGPNHRKFMQLQKELKVEI